MLLPEKDSQKWFYVFLASWLVNLVALVVSRYQVNAILDNSTTFIFVVMSLLIASITVLGWFGLKAFTKTFLLFNVIGLVNMLYITGNLASEGWSDITSLLNYIFFVAMGVVAGLLVELTKFYFDKTEKAKAPKKRVSKPKTTKPKAKPKKKK